MKSLTCLTITLVLMTPLRAQTPPPSEAEAQVRQELNEAAEAYRKGSFAEAQAHSEKALLLDPQNKTAPYFVARTIHAQYKPGDVTPENVAKAQEAIIAYQKILDRWPTDEEAYKAVAFLYGALKEEELLKQWILQRGGNVLLSNEQRAEAFVILASKDWDCSYRITELPANRVVTADGSKVGYRMPKERVEFERAKECANRALEMANMAITLTPENEPAWIYKRNILLELSKLAEMSGDAENKREFQRQAEEAYKETTKLSNRLHSKP